MSVNAPAAAAALAASGGIPLQDASVDTSKLNALSPEVIGRQATVSLALNEAMYIVSNPLD
jgi:hypothetical protein